MFNRILVYGIRILLLSALLLSGCANGKTSPEPESGVKTESAAAVSIAPEKNSFNSLDIPTQITKIGDDYFIVDCYHNQIIFNDNTDDPLEDWSVMTDEINKGHTLAGDGRVYLTDDTENDRILVYKKQGAGFTLTQTFENITSRPHYIVYDKEREAFFVWCSMSGEMYIFKDDKNDGSLYISDVKSVPELNGVYVRSFSLIEDGIYFVSGNKSILKADPDTFEILERYPVPSSMAGMIQITRIGEYFYITVSTDDKWNQDYATILRCHSLKDLQNNEYEDIYHYFIGGGTPYFISEIDGEYYLTEHRLPGHSIWRFRPEGEEIRVESVY